MTETTMNRVIHGAVRRDLRRLEEALRSAPDGDRGRADELARAFAFLHGQLVHHHRGEDEHIFPALRRLGVETELIGDMHEEHEVMANALADTEAALGRYAASGSVADRDAAQEAVAHAREATERHLDHEERELEPLIRPHVETPEWKAAERNVRRGSPAFAGSFFAWVQDGMEPEHRAFLGSAVPAPVRLVLTKVFGRGYRREIAPVWR